MKACVLRGIGQLNYETVPTPVPKAGEVLLKIKASGICGSDVQRIFTKGTYTFPTIPGHEFSGEIAETGTGVPTSLVGRKAVVFPLLPCRKCDMCEIGEYASCRNYNYFGSRCDGGFAEYIASPVWNLVMCGDGPSDGLTFEEMALVEPAAVSVHALSLADTGLGDTVAVFGAGPIGLMLASFAKAGGAENVILLDVDDKKLAFAKSLGWPLTINNGTCGWQDALADITGGKGVDIAIEGAGAAASAEGCFKAAKPRGKVVLMGNPAGDMPIRQDFWWEILRKQLILYGSWNSSYTGQKNDWKTALDAIASARVNISPLITHRFALSECKEAFDLLQDRSRLSYRVMFINN